MAMGAAVRGMPRGIVAVVVLAAVLGARGASACGYNDRPDPDGCFPGWDCAPTSTTIAGAPPDYILTCPHCWRIPPTCAGCPARCDDSPVVWPHGGDPMCAIDPARCDVELSSWSDLPRDLGADVILNCGAA